MATTVSRFRMVLVFVGLVVVGAGGVRRSGPDGPAANGADDVGGGEGEGGEGGGDADEGGGLDGGSGCLAVGEEGVHASPPVGRPVSVRSPGGRSGWPR